MNESWKFNKAFDKDTNKYESNFEIAYQSPVHQTVTNGGIHCASATASTAIQIASNTHTGYRNDIPTMCYEQDIMLHCWQYASQWDRVQRMPAPIACHITIYKPTIKFGSLDIMELTPKINVENLLMDLGYFKDIKDPRQIESLSIIVYLFLDKDPVVASQYALRGETDAGYILPNKRENIWNDCRKTEIDSMRIAIRNRYNLDIGSRVGPGVKYTIRFLNDKIERYRESEKIRIHYPEIFKWYNDFMEETEKKVAEMYPNGYHEEDEETSGDSEV